MSDEPRYFDDFEIGQRFRTAARTITEADVMQFAGLSGDFNPLHTDRTHAETTPFGKPIAHGLLVLAVASGLSGRLGMLDGTAIAFLELTWKFRSPVFFGDTVRAELTVSDKRESQKPDRGVLTRQFRVLNQHETLVQEGQFVTLVRRRGAQSPLARRG